MNDVVRQLVERVNARLAALLEDARGALRGECGFDAESVHQLREPLEEMQPVVAQWFELRRLQPELESQLNLYKAHLGELQITLHQIRMMLLARQASLSASQTHMSAVSQWVSAFRQTR